MAGPVVSACRTGLLLARARFMQLIPMSIPRHLTRRPASSTNTTNQEAIEAMRKPYKGEGEAFDVDQLVAKEPFAQFANWFETACKTEGIGEPNAMSLATATKEGRPSCRIVLLKGFDEQGFRFFTNYSSRKGQELADNPFASLVFFWEPLSRAVRIEGRVERVSEEESIFYFHSRPKPSQVGAALTMQSSIIKDRKELIDKSEELTQKYADSEYLPKPDSWGGYLVRPDVIEFWQGQTTRIHDRIRFRQPKPEEKLDPVVTHRGDKGWVFERLAP